MGCGGSGKSTVAAALAKDLGVAVLHLDKIAWNRGWEPSPDREYADALEATLGLDAWIIDGNHERGRSSRLALADTAIVLDPGPVKCLWRLIRRRIRYRGRVRPDMAPGCVERLRPRYAWHVLTFRRRVLPQLRSELLAAGVPTVDVMSLAPHRGGP